VDPNNPVIRRCAEGMALEAEGRMAEAKQRFDEAWQLASDDYEACVAAHYVARHQADAQSTLAWNLESLRRAESVPDDRVGAFYPSLYLNMGHSLEQTGDLAGARRHFQLAADRLDALPPGPYGDMVRRGVAAGRERLGPESG
jgi:hypothetical protein